MNFPHLIAGVFDESDADARRVSREIEAIRTRFEGEPVGDTLAREKIRTRTSPSTSRLGRAWAAMFIAPLPENYVAHADRNADLRRAQPARDEPGSLPDSHVAGAGSVFEGRLLRAVGGPLPHNAENLIGVGRPPRRDRREGQKVEASAPCADRAPGSSIAA
jgi:hypothetical protein